MEDAGSSERGAFITLGQRSRNAKLIAAGVAAFLIAGVAFALGWILLRNAGDSDSSAQNATDNAAAAALSIAEMSWHASADASVSIVPATAIGVIDGDSIVFRLKSGKEEEVRLIGLDAPEMRVQRDVYGMESAKHVTVLLREHPTVYLEKGRDRRDKYGRLLAYVWFARPGASPSTADVRGKMLNAIMLLDGYAKLYTKVPNTRYSTLFKAYAAQAKAADLGLWDSNLANRVGASATWVPTLVTTSTASPLPYVGNLTSKKFHLVGCENAQKMKRSNRIPLATREDAIDGEYVPCGLCDP